MDSGESVTLLDKICGLRGLNSVGVGGVTVVAGAGMAVWGGVFGIGLAWSERGLFSVRSVRIGAGRGGISSAAAWARLDERLLRRLPPNKLRLLLAPDLVDSVSGSSIGAFFSEVNASLKRRPGDGLRFLLEESSGTSNAKLDCVGRLDFRSLGFDPELVMLGPLTADSVSPCDSSKCAASTEAVLINGEEVV